MQTIEIILETSIALSGVVFVLILLHAILLYEGVINFTFRNPDNIKKLWDFSYKVHINSLFVYILFQIISNN